MTKSDDSLVAVVAAVAGVPSTAVSRPLRTVRAAHPGRVEARRAERALAAALGGAAAVVSHGAALLLRDPDLLAAELSPDISARLAAARALPAAQGLAAAKAIVKVCFQLTHALASAILPARSLAARRMHARHGAQGLVSLGAPASLPF